MKISDVLERETIIPDLQSKTKEEVVKELAENLSAAHPVINQEKLIEVLMEREKLCSTAVDSGVAIPHAKLSGISDIIAGFGRSVQGIDYDSLDAELTHLFIILVAPETSIGAHIQLLARISKIFRNPDLRAKLMTLETKDDIYDSIVMEDAKL